mgnify:CR=1 FL=1
MVNFDDLRRIYEEERRRESAKESEQQQSIKSYWESLSPGRQLKALSDWGSPEKAYYTIENRIRKLVNSSDIYLQLLRDASKEYLDAYGHFRFPLYRMREITSRTGFFRQREIHEGFVEYQSGTITLRDLVYRLSLDKPNGPGGPYYLNLNGSPFGGLLPEGYVKESGVEKMLDEIFSPLMAEQAMRTDRYNRLNILANEFFRVGPTLHKVAEHFHRYPPERHQGTSAFYSSDNFEYSFYCMYPQVEETIEMRKLRTADFGPNDDLATEVNYSTGTHNITISCIPNPKARDAVLGFIRQGLFFTFYREIVGHHNVGGPLT